jgi:hypothetical protein
VPAGEDGVPEAAPLLPPPVSAPLLPPPADVAPPEPTVVEPAAAAEPEPAPARPRIEVAVGMGASIDDAGLTAAGLSAIPSFFAMGGFGDGYLGVDFGAFANNANGRYRAPNIPVDRLDFDGMLVIRPGARAAAGARPAPLSPSYLSRIERTAALDIGLAYERSSRIASTGAQSVTRFGLRLGAHVDLPLTPAPQPGAAGGELRLRLAVRRMFAFATPEFPGGTPVADTRAELFAALAVVF